MITQTAATWQTPPWKEELRNAVTDVNELLTILDLHNTPLARQLSRQDRFPLRVPTAYVQRMEKGNADDPLLRQVLPLADEELEPPGFVADPLQEARFNPVPGIVHKYRGRVLMITSPACAIHCRYCFRRHFPYSDNTLGKNQLAAALDYIAGDPSISEVILSGGDPLAADDRHLQWLVARIAATGHVKRLRVHTRFPVVIPSRVDGACLDWLTRMNTLVVLHINHGNEIDAAVEAMVQALRGRGLTVLNQAVLLKGVNDSVEALVTLHEKLFDAGILPYYLHLLDPVRGASHFDLPAARGLELHRKIRAELPGYLVPRLVRDSPGAASKSLLV